MAIFLSFVKRYTLKGFWDIYAAWGGPQLEQQAYIVSI